MQKIAIVTGGSRGIGAATCRFLGEQGYAVAVNYRSEKEAAEGVVRDIEAAGGRAIAVQADTGVEADIERLFATVDEKLGPVTALVNNAGMVGPRGRFEAVQAGDMERVLAVNVIGPMLCIQAAIKRMSTKHGGRGGAIVNVSSGVSTQGGAGHNVLYGVSKAALNAVTLGLGQELAAEGIRVNTVAPGLTDTDMPGKERIQRDGPTIPIGRAADPKEIAEAIVWLLSDKASYVLTAYLRVGGGRP